MTLPPHTHGAYEAVYGCLMCRDILQAQPVSANPERGEFELDGKPMQATHPYVPGTLRRMTLGEADRAREESLHESD